PRPALVHLPHGARFGTCAACGSDACPMCSGSAVPTAPSVTTRSRDRRPRTWSCGIPAASDSLLAGHIARHVGHPACRVRHFVATPRSLALEIRMPRFAVHATRHPLRLPLALPLVLQLGGALPAPAAAQAQDGKDMVAAFIDERAETYGSLAQEIWDLAEVGYLETESAALLAGHLSDAGFQVEMGVAGIPTAFVARWSSGDGPVLGILAEYDALPGITQDRSPVRTPLDHEAAEIGR